MDNKRRRFLKTLWGGVVVFGTGLVGVPLNRCSTSGSAGVDAAGADLMAAGLDVGADSAPRNIDSATPFPDHITPEELAALPEMTDEEAAAFIEEIDEAAAEVLEEVDANGVPRVPPGQHVVESWPVMVTNPSPRSLEEWQFLVSGEVEKELLFDWEQFQQLPTIEQVSDMHCVTGWTLLNVEWKGIRMGDLLDMAGLTADAKHVITDCEHGYTTNITLEDAQNPTVLVVSGVYGGPLPQEHGGPVRGVVPYKYGYKSGKWATGLRVTKVDEPGYWETKGYSNTADVWSQDRYD